MKNLFSVFIPLTAALISLVGCSGSGSTSSLPSPSSVRQEISLKANGIFYTVTSGGSHVKDADAHIRSSDRFQLDAEDTSLKKDFSINAIASNLNVPYTIRTYTATEFSQWEDGSKIYYTSSSPGSKSRMTFTFTRKMETSTANYFMVEGNFSGVLYNLSNTDSVIISEGLIKILP